MKLRLTVAAATLLAGGGLYFWLGTPEVSHDLEIQKRLLRKSARGTADDPIARERWEFERLKDPTTGRIPRGIRAKELSFASTLPTKESVARQTLAKGGQAQVFSWVKRGPHNVGGRTRALAVDVTNTSVLLGGGVSGGMWRSTDDGATWVKTTGSADIHSVTTVAQDTRSGKESTWYYGTGEGIGNSASKTGAFFNGAGAFKSSNGGASWTVLASTVGNSPVGAIDSFFDVVWRLAIDPSNTTQDEIYAATLLGVLRSTSGGTTGGATTPPTPSLGAFSNSGPYYTDVAVTSGGVVYAALSALALNGTFNATNKGIWRSIDGITWTEISSGVSGFPTQYSRIVIAVAPSNENIVYFLIEGTNGTNQINDHQLWKYTYITSDGSGLGGTWVNRGQNLPNESGLTGNAVFDTQGGYDMHLAVKPDDENFLLVGGVNLYRSTDAFATTSNWTRIGGYATKDTYASYTNQHADQHSGMFRPGSSSIFYSGHDGGISKTTNISASTVSWTLLNNGYITTQFYTLAIDHGTNGNNVIIGGTQDNGTWFTNNTTVTSAWASLFGGDGAYCAVADGRTSYYVSSQNGNMYRVILDANGNWINWANVQPTGGSNYSFINPFVLDPNNTNMMYLAGGDRVWRNTDLTAIPTGADNTTSVNWTALTNALLPLSGSGERISSLTVSKGGTANRVYIGSNAASLYKIEGANSGSPGLTDLTPTGFPSSGNVGCAAVNPNDADEVIAVFTNYGIPSLFASTNGGTSWTDVSSNLEENPNGTGSGPSCRWAAIVPTTQGKTYFVATSTGLYSATSLNGSSTVWSLEGASVIGNVVVDMIDFRASDGVVVVGTHGTGIYSSNILTSSPAPEIGIPTSFSLAQNFPNPFNPSTTIQYFLPERAKVRIAVFDLAGRELAVLTDREHNQGVHTVRWNARDTRNRPVSSGTYFYRMTAVGAGNEVLFSQAEKMTYVK
ncbi:MAG: T9SS type A sorting domain-containing protein [Ignavibacteriales bacterium]|nr:T9SS type A sorting domain-containing protein [Ignavibacteriales bacterium]